VVRSQLDGAEAGVRQFVSGITVLAAPVDADAARRDAAALEAALQLDPENARLAHELAAAYRQAEQYESASVAYRRALTMGGSEEQIAESMLWSARLLERAGGRPDDVVAAYLKAFQAHPARAEALVDLARFCRDHKLFDLARMAAGHALGIPMPREETWADEEVYAWRCLDEYAVASYWTGHEAECVAACRHLLDDPALPEAHRSRVEANLNAAVAKLGAEASAITPAVLPRQANRETADSRDQVVEVAPVEAPVLTDLLSPTRRVYVTLVGVDEPAGDLMERQLCWVTRFEPMPERYDAVRELALPNQTVLPFALGDGAERSVWSGVHPAEPRVLETFGWLAPPSGDARTVATRRLDDVSELEVVDLLHIDLRHADLSAFRHGRTRLAAAVAVQARLALIAVHPDQPSLGEFDLAARELGLVPHAITEVERTSMAPWGGDPAPGARGRGRLRPRLHPAGVDERRAADPARAARAPLLGLSRPRAALPAATRAARRDRAGRRGDIPASGGADRGDRPRRLDQRPTARQMSVLHGVLGQRQRPVVGLPRLGRAFRARQ
jgi:hypothetical protein